MKIIEGNYPINYIIHCHSHKPTFIISERDIIDKRTEFVYDDIYYNLSTSIDENIFDILHNVIRCQIYINLFLIAMDEKFFYFMNFNQIDLKMWFPDNLLNYIVPYKIEKFYENLINFINK